MIKDRDYRHICSSCIIYGCFGFIVAMIILMVFDYRSHGLIEILTFLPIFIGIIPGLIYPLLYKLNIVDGFYKYDQDEIGALNQFYKDIEK